MRLLFILLSLAFAAGFHTRAASTDSRHRILISTDIGGTDPDDNQSMTHLLMYANEFDIEGLVSSPSYGTGSKEEILRMIDMYRHDLPLLEAGLRRDFGSERGSYPSPEFLESVTVQGSRSAAPLRGFSSPTEGSEWIVKCARSADDRPLWVLVWGALEDVAQALHDAPDIAEKIRVYWIGGPNKKWGCNAYDYIARNFPSLWFIENNASYRGFIGSASDQSAYQAPFWESFMKGAGVLGDDFVNYYKGIVKMGDSPSLFYLMNGDADRPDSDHWGGRFEPLNYSPAYVVTGALSAGDTVPCYSLMEWRIKGPVADLPANSACITLTIDRQEWPGYYEGEGWYVVRYSPKAPARLPYSLTSTVAGFPAHEGIFTVADRWPGEQYQGNDSTLSARHIPLSGPRRPSRWYTDIQDYTEKWQGSPTIARYRDEIMRDWGARLAWLKR